MTPSPAVAREPREELKALYAEQAAQRTKLDADKKTLADLTAERAGLGEAIAAGKAKPEAVGAIARKIEQAQAVVEGGTAIFKRLTARIEEVAPVVSRLEEAETLAARRAELAKLKADGEAIAGRINEKLAAILSLDLPAFDAISDKMAKDFANLNGGAEASAMVKLLCARDNRLQAEIALRAAGWKRRSDVQLTLHNLWPPK